MTMVRSDYIKMGIGDRRFEGDLKFIGLEWKKT
jgi:hypothetical protein